MFGLQPWHLIVVAAVALIIFGPSRLPEVGKAIGKTLREFREAATTAEDGIKQGLEAQPKPQTIVPPPEQAKPYIPSEPDKPNL